MPVVAEPAYPSAVGCRGASRDRRQRRRPDSLPAPCRRPCGHVNDATRGAADYGKPWNCTTLTQTRGSAARRSAPVRANYGAPTLHGFPGQSTLKVTGTLRPRAGAVKPPSYPLVLGTLLDTPATGPPEKVSNWRALPRQGRSASKCARSQSAATAGRRRLPARRPRRGGLSSGRAVLPVLPVLPGRRSSKAVMPPLYTKGAGGLPRGALGVVARVNAQAVAGQHPARADTRHGVSAGRSPPVPGVAAASRLSDEIAQDAERGSQFSSRGHHSSTGSGSPWNATMK